MKFYYVTSVLIPAVNAQSVQIMSTAAALAGKLNQDFELVSPLVNDVESSNLSWWRRLSCFFSKGRARYLEFAIRVVFFKLERKSVFYTRDVLLALIASFKCDTVIYEGHVRPSLKAKLILKFLLRSKKVGLVVISKALSNYYVGEFKLNELDVCVAHDAVDLEKYRRVRPNRECFYELGVPRDLKVVLHTGSLYPGRGGELFSGILNNFEDIALVHIGGDEKFLKPYRKMLNSDRFFCHKHVSQEKLVEYQLSADVLLYPMMRSTPTYWCCSPMKIFEYMASKRPIVCSSIGSLTEIVNNESAYLFDPECLSSLIHSIDSSIYSKDKEIRASKAYALVEKQFTWHHRADIILRYIHERCSR